MRCDRRAFLAGAGGAAFGALGLLPSIARAEGRPIFVSCGVDDDGRYVVGGLEPTGALRYERALPARGHDVAFDPRGRHCVVFARRPGTFAAVLDTASGAVLHWIEAAPGRHFYGHGTFSADGRTLFATENDYDGGRGVLGVYDARAGYKRLGEVSSDGVGPHDARLMPDGKTLAVANGGVRTHPDRPRANLNVDTMAPNLAYLDAESGRVLQTAQLPQRLHQLSIRHVDVAGDGRVVVAMQYEGDRRNRVPLVGLHDGGDEIRLFHAPERIEKAMRQYTGAVVFDASGAFFAASSPRGHVVTMWEGRSGEFLHHARAFDASAISPTGRDGEFLVAGGDGTIQHLDARSGKATVLQTPGERVHWDNHVARAVPA